MRHLNTILFYLDEEDFSQLFFNILDSIEETDTDRVELLQIEFAILQIIKTDLLADIGDWIGSLSQNKKVDRMITNVIRSSLNQYEKSKKLNEKSFFTF